MVPLPGPHGAVRGSGGRRARPGGNGRLPQTRRGVDARGNAIEATALSPCGRADPSPEERTMIPAGAIDCDLHPAVPDTRALLPHLEPYWREHVLRRGMERDNLEASAF